MLTRKNFLTSILGVVLNSAIAFSHDVNPILQATMKAISQDVQTISVPAKKPTPGDVTDGMILAGIVRARTAQSSMQLVIDRKDHEMLPPFIEELAKKEPEKAKELMVQYPEHLSKAKAKLVDAETQLQKEFAKTDPETRDFAPLKTTLADLETIIAESHKIFRP